MDIAFPAGCPKLVGETQGGALFGPLPALGALNQSNGGQPRQVGRWKQRFPLTNGPGMLSEPGHVRQWSIGCQDGKPERSGRLALGTWES